MYKERKRPNVSIAMATYNGEPFIREQLSSILKQMGPEDELIISDDGSTDNTRRIIASFADHRILLIDGPCRGVKKNFENAIDHCKHDYIFLADQDDIWHDDKINVVIDAFLENPLITCVVHDCQVVDEKNTTVLMDSFYRFKNGKPGIIKNIIRNSYIGCCMCFHRSLNQYCLPIPDHIEMHDQWIGVWSDMRGKTAFISDKLIRYRRHEQNASQIQHYPLGRMLKNRVVFIFSLIRRIRKKQ